VDPQVQTRKVSATAACRPQRNGRDSTTRKYRDNSTSVPQQEQSARRGENKENPRRRTGSPREKPRGEEYVERRAAKWEAANCAGPDAVLFCGKTQGNAACKTASTATSFGIVCVLGRGTQAVRERSAKPLCVGSIPTRASKITLLFLETWRRYQLICTRFVPGIFCASIGSCSQVRATSASSCSWRERTQGL
jgi:hypothetical protein